MCMCVKSLCSVSFLFLSLCSVVHYACDCSGVGESLSYEL